MPQSSWQAQVYTALKAARILCERRLTVTSVHRGRITATVRGDGQSYHLGFTAGRWWCPTG